MQDGFVGSGRTAGGKMVLDGVCIVWFLVLEGRWSSPREGKSGYRGTVHIVTLQYNRWEIPAQPLKSVYHGVRVEEREWGLAC